MSIVRFLKAWLFACLCSSLPVFAAPIPIADCLRRPEITQVSISEDGRNVVFLTPSKEGDFYDLNVFETATGASRKFDLKGDEVLSYKWLDSSRLLISSRNLPAINMRQIIFDVTKDSILRYYASNIRIASALRHDKKLLFGIVSSRDSRSGPAILNLNKRANPGDTNILVHEWISIPSGDIHTYQYDWDGIPRVIIVFQTGRLKYYYRQSLSSDWLELPLDPENTRILGFDSNPDYLYVGHFAANATTSAFRRYQVSSGEFGPELYSDPFYSMYDALLKSVRTDSGKIRPLALAYERDHLVQLPLDPEFAAIQKEINELLPGRLNEIQTHDQALQRFIIGSSSGREFRNLVYTRKGKSLTALPDPFPWIDPHTTGIPKPIRYVARDGIELDGFLILPSSIPDGKKPPVIVQCLDDFSTRFTWGFNLEEQFYLSRGYALFQPNTRGASGRNRAISKDGAYNFELMRTDILDGVSHLIDKGLVDKNRICIQGESFGAFNALALTEQAPDMFKCAILKSGFYDWAGVMHANWVYEDRRRYVHDLYIRKFGTPSENLEKFNNMSPIAHVASIKVPLLIVSEDDIFSESRKQTIKLLKELQSHGVDHIDLVLKNSIKARTRFETQQQYLEAVETFIAKHL